MFDKISDIPDPKHLIQLNYQNLVKYLVIIDPISILIMIHYIFVQIINLLVILNKPTRTKEIVLVLADCINILHIILIVNVIIVLIQVDDVILIVKVNVINVFTTIANTNVINEVITYVDYLYDFFVYDLLILNI